MGVAWHQAILIILAKRGAYILKLEVKTGKEIYNLVSNYGKGEELWISASDLITGLRADLQEQQKVLDDAEITDGLDLAYAEGIRQYLKNLLGELKE